VSDVTEEAFRMFDTDGSGSISRQEFEQAMMALGFRPSEALWQEADADGSGEIDVDEFAEVLRKNRIDLTAELEMLTPEERDRLKEAKGAKFRKYKLMPRAKVGNV
jgi:Ca2+-binding EF-hand superfamily protein